MIQLPLLPSPPESDRDGIRTCNADAAVQWRTPDGFAFACERHRMEMRATLVVLDFAVLSSGRARCGWRVET